jgi:hypothetical protein
MNDKRKTRLVLNDKTDESIMYVIPNACKRCLFCTLDIDHHRSSVGCPIRYIENHNDIKHNDRQHSGEYISHGIFCSYNCAKAFALEKQQYDPMFANSSRYINVIVNKDSEKIIDVIPSPPKDLLRMYGGYMTEDQYKSEIGKILYNHNGSTVLHPVALVYTRKINNC